MRQAGKAHTALNTLQSSINICSRREGRDQHPPSVSPFKAHSSFCAVPAWLSGEPAVGLRDNWRGPISLPPAPTNDSPRHQSSLSDSASLVINQGLKLGHLGSHASRLQSNSWLDFDNDMQYAFVKPPPHTQTLGAALTPHPCGPQATTTQPGSARLSL